MEKERFLSSGFLLRIVKSATVSVMWRMNKREIEVLK
jgi:hypothetical protein